MIESREETTYRHARREAVATLAVFVILLCYTVGVSYWLGYDRPAEEMRLILGIPDWAFYGVLVPWALMFPITAWFCFRFMADDDLSAAEDRQESPDA